MDKFLDMYNLPKSNHKEIENQNILLLGHLKKAKEYRNRSITSNKLEAVIKSLPSKKSLGLNGFTAEFCQTYKELTRIFLSLFQKMKEDRIISNLFYKTSITFTIFVCLFLRQDLILLPLLECGGTITAYCSLDLLGASDPHDSAS